MGMEQGLYAQIVVLCRKDLKSADANKNKNEDKFKFQGQPTISQRCFDLDFIGLKKNLTHLNLTFIENSFRGMTINKIQNHLKYFKFQ